MEVGQIWTPDNMEYDKCVMYLGILAIFSRDAKKDLHLDIKML